MDIDLLSKMVKELILDNDEVTLPGVGTFVAEIVPSTFSDKGYTINPPYRKLSFRQRQSDDTSLLDFYMLSNDVDKDSADRILTEFLTELKDVLKQKKLIIFPGLGRLRATKENNFFFIADEDLDIYPGGFGLEPISLKTHQETKEEVDATLAGLKSIIEAPVVEAEEPEPVPVLEEIAPSSAESQIETAEEEVKAEEEVPVVPTPSEETMAFVAGLNEIPEVVPSVDEEPKEDPEITTTFEEPTVVDEVQVKEEVEEEAVEEEPSKEPSLEQEPEEVTTLEPAVEATPEPSIEPSVEPVVEEAVEKVDEPEHKNEEYKVIDDIKPEPVAPNSSAQGPDIKELAKNISEPVPMPKADPKPNKGAKVVGKILKVILVLVIIAAIALLAFVLLAHVAPDFVDSILYTPEELRIINY